MAERYGARPEAWDEWVALGAGKNLLPAVANPNAKISPDSDLREIGKTPSWYNGQRHVVGIAKWTKIQATDSQIEKWKNEPDYSLLVQTRDEIRALDLDLADKIKSHTIRDAVTDMLGPCPVRYRENSGKLLIPFRYKGELTKRVLPVDGGMIEMLAKGQQFVAEGLHPSGVHYKWNGTALPEMPVLDEERLNALTSMLEVCFGTGEWKIAREKRKGTALAIPVHDDVADWLLENWETYDVGPNDEIWIECPYSFSHTTDSGPSSTAYFPAGTGGYSQGHFVCLHAHCTGRDDRDFLDAVGYSASQFADLVGSPPESGAGDPPPPVPPPLPWPELKRDKNGILPTQLNLVRMCSTPHLIGKKLAFDAFRDELIWAPWDQPDGQEQWRTFTDVDYAYVRMELEKRGVKPMGHELLRSSVAASAIDRRIDTAQEWLSRLKWDGVERIDAFCALGWGWTQSDYSAAVGRYVWTAMAGRVLEPGCQADMAPILVGPQGAGKTSAIKAMVPDEEFYTTIPLDGHDDDTSRRLRGKLVGELEELRGLNSRHIEEIKAWITRTSEGWIPKYKEFEARFKRRLIFFGSTNDEEFLNDPTGERRWLPGRCGELGIEWIKEHRDQLWAEGAAKFLLEGVAWEEAQRLGLEEHHEFKVVDSWEASVLGWLKEKWTINGLTPEEVGYVTTGEALTGAVNVPVSQHDRAKEMRMAKVLRGLGWERKRIVVDDKRIWAYVKGEE